MSEPMRIRESESGLVRLFALDLPEPEARALAEGREAAEPDTQAALEEMLGAIHLDIEQVEIFPRRNLEGLGLQAYLEQGHGIPAAELAVHRALLEMPPEWIVLVPSRAFERVAQTIRPTAPLRWIATFAETPGTRASPEPKSPSAQGRTAPPAPAPAPRRSLPYGRLVMGLLVLLALGLWLGGVLPGGSGP